MTRNSTKIICIVQNKTDEPVLSSYGMKSLTFNEVKESGVKQKFYSQILDHTFTRSKIMKIVTKYWDRISDEDEFNSIMLYSKIAMLEWLDENWKTTHLDPTKYMIPFDLVKLDNNPIKRWDKFENKMRPHNHECEFATGHTCDCWCGEKYHGMMGVI